MDAGVIGAGKRGAAVAAQLRSAGLLRTTFSGVGDGEPVGASDTANFDHAAAACRIVLVEGLANFGAFAASLQRVPAPAVQAVIILGSGHGQGADLDLAVPNLAVPVAACCLVETGNGTVALVGGEQRAIGLAEPVIEQLATRSIHTGDLGSAVAAEAAFYALRAGYQRAKFDSTRLAQAGGVRSAAIAQLSQLATSAEPLASAAPTFSAEALRSEVAGALALATRLGVALPTAQLAAASAEQLAGTDDANIPAGPTPFDRGLQVFEQVYGPGSSKPLVGSDRSDFAVETVSHLFGEIWSRPNLSIRDRRLLLIGVTATLGREDLVIVQARAALVNNELTEAQLDEMVMFLAFYVGWCNSGPIHSGVNKAKLQFHDGATSQ